MNSLCTIRQWEAGVNYSVQQLMGLCNAGEVLQHVLDGELHGDSRSRVTPANQIFKVLVLSDELVLHGVPHHLMEKTQGRGSEGG